MIICMSPMSLKKKNKLIKSLTKKEPPKKPTKSDAKEFEGCDLKDETEKIS